MSAVLSACSDGVVFEQRTAIAPEPGVYVAVGASESVGVGASDPSQGWTQVFWREVVPAGYSFVNVAINGATVRKALDVELPEALKYDPDLVTVWLNTNDVIQAVPPATYEAEIRHLVRALRQGGRTRVLVANTPPIDILPVLRPFRSNVNRLSHAYNEAIARVVREEGAELVDLHAAGRAARERGEVARLVDRDGLHPTTDGHRNVAAEFAKVYTGKAASTAP